MVGAHRNSAMVPVDQFTAKGSIIVCACVCVCVCVCACVRARARACVRACVRACMCVFPYIYTLHIHTVHTQIAKRVTAGTVG